MRKLLNQPPAIDILPIYQEMLPGRFIQSLLTGCGQSFYQRLFTPVVVLWGFIYQRLNADHTCEAALSYLTSGQADDLDQGHRLSLAERIKSASTAAYCKARQRLPLGLLVGSLSHSAQVIQDQLGSAGVWHGHPVGLLDGTTIYLSPTPELVEHYGQHRNGRGPTYWIIMRVVVAFSLRTAAVLGVADGPRLTSEQQLAKQVLAQAQPNSVQVGDSNFGVFSVAQAARHYDVKCLLRLTRQRARVLFKAALPAQADLPLTWSPSAADQLDPTMSALPVVGRFLAVHLVRPGFRPVDLYLFTTLIDPQQYPLADLLELYGYRWHAELNLRYVKATLDMAHLPGKSVAMVQKELGAGLLAYNLIRGYMAQAAHQAGCSPLTLSFSRCWRRVAEMLRSVRPSTAPAIRQQTTTRLLRQLAQARLVQRPPHRIEPRAIRGQPHVYPYLKGSRAAARQRALLQRQQPKAEPKAIPTPPSPSLILTLPAAAIAYQLGP